MVRASVSLLAASIAVLQATAAFGQLCVPGAVEIGVPTTFHTAAPDPREAPGCEDGEPSDWTAWFTIDAPRTAAPRLQIVASSATDVPLTMTLHEPHFAFLCDGESVIACGEPYENATESGVSIWFDADPGKRYYVRVASPAGVPTEGVFAVRRPGLESRIVVTRFGDETATFPPDMGDGSDVTVQAGEEIIITAQVRHVGGEGRFEGVLTAAGYVTFFDWPGAGELVSHEATYTQASPFDIIAVHGYWPAWSLTHRPDLQSPTYQNRKTSFSVSAIQNPLPSQFVPTADGEWLNFYSARYHILDAAERDIFLRWVPGDIAPFYIRDDGRAWWDETRGAYHNNQRQQVLQIHVNGETFPCPCDENGDGFADIFDLIDFVNSFLANELAADYLEDGIIDVFDLLAFLDCWMPASGGIPCR